MFERRRVKRFKFSSPATIQSEHDMAEICVVDISLKGLKVRELPDKPILSLHNRFLVTIALADGDVAKTKLDCKCIYHRGEEWGLEMVGMSTESKKLLLNLLESKLPDPAMLQREAASLLDP